MTKGKMRVYKGAKVKVSYRGRVIEHVVKKYPRYNCHGCGRFLSDEEVKEYEVRCTGCA